MAGAAVLTTLVASASKDGGDTAVTLDAPTLFGAALALFVALLGSSVISTVIKSRFSRGSELARVRRGVAKRALLALGRAQSTVNTLRDKAPNVTPDELRELAARNIELESLVALSANSKLIAATRDYRKTSENFVGGIFGTNATVQRARFESVIDLLSDYLR